VDQYNRQVRDFYIVKLVADDSGGITDQIVKTVPSVSQFWTFDPAEFMANPLFSKEYPPVSG